MILEQGEAKLAKHPLCLALQGIGTEEAEAFSLLMEDDSLLCQLAGNPLFLCQYMLGFLDYGNKATSCPLYPSHHL
jgi:hypothetical protein